MARAPSASGSMCDQSVCDAPAQPRSCRRARARWWSSQRPSAVRMRTVPCSSRSRRPAHPTQCSRWPPALPRATAPSPHAPLRRAQPDRARRCRRSTRRFVVRLRAELRHRLRIFGREAREPLRRSTALCKRRVVELVRGRAPLRCRRCCGSSTVTSMLSPPVETWFTAYRVLPRAPPDDRDARLLRLGRTRARAS